MHPVIAAIGRHAAAHPRRPALTDGAREISYLTLNRAIADTGAEMRMRTSKPVALCLDNSPEWIIADLALLATRLPCVPLPSFFSAQQQAHAAADAGVECVVTDQPERCIVRLRSAGLPAVRDAEFHLAGRRLACIRIGVQPAAALPRGTVKITYTSGTTGNPKGVCLGGDALAKVARSLASACGLGAGDRHLSLLPLATLLENLGVYASLVAGACCALPPLEEIGIAGASGVQPAALLDAMARHRATTAIMVPQMLQAVVGRIERGAPVPSNLRFLAVGGAVVTPALLQRAATLGLPVFEGYGLSECGSVVSLNTPQANRRGSAGRPLPHCTLSFGRDGEIYAAGATLLGYHGAAAPAGNAWPTGDIGHLDDEGYLHITGRKKDCFISSYGRNVSPEWIEAALTLEPAIAQAWATGEARPWVAAVITPAPGQSDDAVNAAVARANRALPGYAQVRNWIASSESFSCSNGELTANGRLRRAALFARYQAAIDALYREETHALSR
ncbi:MAG TPA: AMP-binding protein [Burkholderiales bacterium]|nr:AMP-binding protein [Burkholderiales bacterium]